jgi:hypothetical protein
MKKAFIRALWGDVANHRNGKISLEIQKVEDKSWFTVYVFGIDNYTWLKDLGFNVVLVDNESTKWDLETEMYRHKLEVFDRAMEDFDEIAFLDWDCVPTGDISNAWSELGKKAEFQANLFQYRTKKCLWRSEDQRKVCNGGFVYMRDKGAPYQIIRIWDEFHKWVDKRKAERNARGLELRFREKCMIFDDEPAMSKYVDEIYGRWCGIYEYWMNFEPTVCNLKRKSVYNKEKLDQKPACFMHML